MMIAALDYLKYTGHGFGVMFFPKWALGTDVVDHFNRRFPDVLSSRGKDSKTDPANLSKQEHENFVRSSPAPQRTHLMLMRRLSRNVIIVLMSSFVATSGLLAYIVICDKFTTAVGTVLATIAASCVGAIVKILAPLGKSLLECEAIEQRKDMPNDES